MPHLALSDQVLDGTRDLLHRNVGIDAVLVEEIDAVGLQSLERCFGDVTNMRGAAVHARHGLAILEAEFGGDNDLVPERGEGFTDDLFVRKGAIRLSCVKKRYASIKGRSDEIHGMLPRLRGTVSKVQSHAPEAESGDFQTTVTERAQMHGHLLFQAQAWYVQSISFQSGAR